MDTHFANNIASPTPASTPTLTMNKHANATGDPMALHMTPHAGRTFRATRALPPNTLLLTCSAPYASVIYSQFRKVVCAWCFTHVSASPTPRAASCATPSPVEKPQSTHTDEISPPPDDENPDYAPPSKSKSKSKSKYTLSIPDAGVWFCSEECKDHWEREEDAGGMLRRVWVAFGAALKRMRKERAESMRVVQGGSGIGSVYDGEVTAEIIDEAWKKAEARQWKNDVVHMDDIELGFARFVASAIVRRFIEDIAPSPAAAATATSAPGSWGAFLELQPNELAAHVRGPALLAVHVRVFAFLRWVLPLELRGYVEGADFVRAVLAREPGNAFGIWEGGPGRGEENGEENGEDGDGEDDWRGEMFGWGVYISASYFNHSCAPNVRKEAAGRGYVFYTARAVEEGEELCISYIGEEMGVEERRKCLSDNWYFECRCGRCVCEDEDVEIILGGS